MLFALHFFDIHKYSDECVLGQVMAHFIIIDHAINEREYQSFVDSDELVHCALITILSTLDEVRKIIVAEIQGLLDFFLLSGQSIDDSQGNTENRH